MCGICGFTNAVDDGADLAALKAMCDVMAHRGPDGEGFYLSDGIALGHRRLSLIDMAGGGQPMVRSSSALRADVSSPAVAFDHVRGQAAQVADAPGVQQGAFQRGRWSIVFNGEIYNYRELRAELQALGYRFETNSDTEVLLVGYLAWSKGVLQRLRGMFAFAVYDADTHELFCARDFFGIKPFYYTLQETERGTQFVFASEIKSILEHPAYNPQLNEHALAQYLCFQFSALRETFFKGVYKLMQGHCMWVGADGTVEVERYWQPRYRLGEMSEPSAIADAIGNAMRESVRFHNVADVEVGSFLSSGIDSSYLTALLAQENPSVRTFTVGFAEYQGERDEVSWARELSERIGLYNDSHHISEEEYWRVLPSVQWHMDEPSADPSAVALYYVDKLAARHVKAVLSGEGADEFFGGYRIYQAPLANARLGKLPKGMLRTGSKLLHALGRRGANFLKRASEQVEDWYYTNANDVAFSPAERDRILAFDVRERLAEAVHAGGAAELVGLGIGGGVPLLGVPTPQQLTAPVYAEIAGADEPSRMQYLDLWFWLAGDILLKTDKMSMAHSLESRVPFLDREVFELAAGIPTSCKVSNAQTKVALREAAGRTVPRGWAQKEKLGFPVPLRSWLCEEHYYELVKSEFMSNEAARFFDSGELMRLLDEHRGGIDHSRRIWIVYSFLVWYRVYFVERKKPA